MRNSNVLSCTTKTRVTAEAPDSPGVDNKSVTLDTTRSRFLCRDRPAAAPGRSKAFGRRTRTPGRPRSSTTNLQLQPTNSQASLCRSSYIHTQRCPARRIMSPCSAVVLLVLMSSSVIDLALAAADNRGAAVSSTSSNQRTQPLPQHDSSSRSSNLVPDQEHEAAVEGGEMMAVAQSPSQTPGRGLASAGADTSDQSVRIDKDEMAKALEGSLLQMFGLTSRPRPRKGVHIPQYMLDLYEQHMGGSQKRRHGRSQRQHVHSADTIRSFIQLVHDDVSVLSDDPNEVTLKFDLASLSSDETLRAAELRLFRQGANTSSSQHPHATKDLTSVLQQQHRIDVFEVVRPGRRGREPIVRMLDTRVVDPTRSKWETFDISAAVANWRGSHSRNHGLLVRFSVLNGQASRLRHVRLKRSLDTPDEQWNTEKPLLVTYSNHRSGHAGSRRGRRNKRTRRSNSRKRRGKKRDEKRSRRRNKNRGQRCRRRPLYVDFKDVGWNDWIVAPSGYHAYYCHGECPFPLAEHYNSTNHAIVQTLVHSVDQQAVPRPCCVPTELSTISMLYLNEYEKVVLRNYKNMVVEACGCR